MTLAIRMEGSGPSLLAVEESKAEDNSSCKDRSTADNSMSSSIDMNLGKAIR